MIIRFRARLGARRLTRARNVLVMVSLIAATTAGATVAGTDATPSVTSQTFTYTGAPQSFTVPAGITSLTVDAAGAQGGSATATSAYRDTVVADNPVSYWRLGETSGTAAADAQSSHPGTYLNAPALGQPSLVPSSLNAAVGFDGSNDYVQVASSSGLSFTTKLTLEAWIKPSALPANGSFASIVTKPGAYSLQFNGPQLELTVVQGGTAQRLQAPVGAVSIGGTYHVVATYDGGHQRLYVNDTQVAARLQTGATTTNGNALRIGSADGTADFFNGVIDDVAVYGTALSASQVDAHYVAGSAGSPAGGKGGRVQTTLAVTPGDTLQINVGGAGSSGRGGWNGGGDASSVGTSYTQAWTASDGSAWPSDWTTAGSGTRDVQQDMGRMVVPGSWGATGGARLTAMPASVDQEVVVRLRFENPKVEQYPLVGVRTKGTIVGNYPESGYFVELPVNSNLIELRRAVDQNFTLLTTVSNTYTAGTDVWVRLRATGSTISARVWNVGSSEPSTWDVNYTDSSPYLSAGQPWLAAQTGSSSTSSTVYWDDLTATTPSGIAGGGGGGTDIRQGGTALANRIVVAGGGGGSGSGDGVSGSGGGGAGGDGGAAGAHGGDGVDYGDEGGRGASTTSGGTAGSAGPSVVGTAATGGASGQGGSGGAGVGAYAASFTGGGGGGGYYGGGGGKGGSGQQSPAGLAETWTGINGDSWPSGWSIGTNHTGTSTNDIQSNTGRLGMVAAANTWTMAVANTFSAADASMRLKWKPDTASFVTFQLRESGSGWTQTSAYTLNYSSVSGLYLGKTVNFSSSALTGNTSLPGTTSQWYQTRFEVSGSAIRAKVWLDGSTEPSTWTLSSNSTAITGTGAAAIQVGAASTSGTYQSFFDDLTVTSHDTPSSGSYHDGGGGGGGSSYAGSGTSATTITSGHRTGNGEVTLTWSTWSVTLSASTATPNTGTSVTLTATANQSVTNSGYVIELFDQGTGALVGTCGSGTTCQALVSRSTYGSNSYVAYIAVSGSSLPPNDVQAVSPGLTVTWTNLWSTSLATNNATPVVGTAVTLTAVSSESITGTPYVTGIYDLNTSQLIGSCSSGTTCSVTTSQGAPGTHTFIAYVAEPGSTAPPPNVQATSNTVNVNWGAGSPPPSSWQVALVATPPVMTSGNAITLTAVANNDVDGTGYTIMIFDQSAGERIKVCASGQTCTVNVTQSGASTVNYIAFVAPETTEHPPPNIQASSGATTAIWL